MHNEISSAPPVPPLLSQLPALFGFDDVLALSNNNNDLALTRLYNWNANHHVARFLPNGDLYFNVAIYPHAQRDYLEVALSRQYEGILIGGMSALHRHGWTTQIPSRVEVVVPPTMKVPSLQGFHFLHLSKNHYDLLATHSEESAGVRIVEPAWALAGLCATSWCPCSEDLEDEEVQLQAKEIHEAFSALHVELNDDLLEVMGWPRDQRKANP